MNLTIRSPKKAAILVAALAAATCLAPPFAPPARAQASGMAGIGGTDTITARVTVQAIDPATRTLILVGPAGNRVSLVAGPQVINFDKIKAGDTVLVHYRESAAFVLSPPNAKIPQSSLTAAGVGAAKGDTPAGAASAKLVVTGLVVGIDPSNHSLQLVNPSGGEVITVHVRSRAGMQNFNLVKVGDTITAVISAAIAVALEPAS